MTFEDLITLKEAQKVIERLAMSQGIDIKELNDEAYEDAHKSLGKIIDRWERKPWYIEKNLIKECEKWT